MIRLHHVQISISAGGEDLGRRFYAEGLGLTEVPKPDELARRGGAWFRAHDDAGTVVAEIHLGVDNPFIPAQKAHPAFVLGAAEFAAAAERLESLGFSVDWTERETFSGYERFHTRDGHGNRVEVLTPVAGSH